MPPILQADLDHQKETQVISILQSLKKNMLKSAFDEMKNSIDLHNIPSKEALVNESILVKSECIEFVFQITKSIRKFIQ